MFDIKLYRQPDAHRVRTKYYQQKSVNYVTYFKNCVTFFSLTSSTFALYSL